MVTKQTIARGGKKAVKVIFNLMKYIIPAVFVLKVLEHSGWLIRIADFFAPYMAYIGLPGEAALVIMMGQVSIYSAIAVTLTLSLTVKQITIVSAFVSMFHTIVLETAVVSKGGGNGLLSAVLRFIGAVLVCLMLNLIISGV
jgi:spore maturation protein SpmB